MAGREIITVCPTCGEHYWVAESHLGREAECEACGTPFTVQERPTPITSGDLVSLPYPDLTVAKVEGGSYYVGNDRGFLSERPRHRVTFSYDFWISTTPVTQRLYDSITKSNPAHRPGPSLPVENVSWHQAQEFCYLLTQAALGSGFIPEGFGFRLPTDAEWECACRPEGSPPPSGFDATTVAWLRDNSSRQTHPVGQKPANKRGLHDMLGNVSEWCLDWFAPYPRTEVTDPKGPPSGTRKVRRGGSFASSRSRCRPTDRFGVDPAHKSPLLGFRIVLAPR